MLQPSTWCRSATQWHLRKWIWRVQCCCCCYYYCYWFASPSQKTTALIAFVINCCLVIKLLDGIVVINLQNKINKQISNFGWDSQPHLSLSPRTLSLSLSLSPCTLPLSLPLSLSLSFSFSLSLPLSLFPWVLSYCQLLLLVYNVINCFISITIQPSFAILLSYLLLL